MTTATNEMLQGVKRIILWRYLKDAETKPGSKIALQTEHEASSSRDINAVPTKDGTKRSLGQVEQEVEVTSYLADSDEVDRMKEAHEMGEKIEVWDVTNEHPDENGKYKATYYQGFIGEISEKAPNDDGIEVTTTISVDGIGKRGRTTLSDDQAEILDYLFVEASAGTTQEAAREAANKSGADTYAPVGQDVNTALNVVPNPKDGIQNSAQLPSDAVYTWVSNPKVDAPGTVSADIKVAYTDTTSDTVTVNVIVAGA